MAYNIGLTVLSLAVAVAVTMAGLAVAANGAARWAAPIGGAIVGAGIAGMHYTRHVGAGVARLSDLERRSGAGVDRARRGARRPSRWTIAVRRSGLGGTVVAAVLLTLAIVSHHFTAMGAVQIVPDPTLDFTDDVLSPATLAIAVAGAAIAVLGMSLVGAIADSLSRSAHAAVRARAAGS